MARKKSPTKTPKRVHQENKRKRFHISNLVRDEYRNRGGFIKDPPEGCRFRKKTSENVFWTDLSLCGSACEEKCERFRRFTKMDKTERKDDLVKRGVKPIKGWDK